MGWPPFSYCPCSKCFTYSLERRIIPRCSVIRVLLSKGLINEENKIYLSSLVINSNKRFLDTFVTKYQDHVPQLLNIFHGKMTIGELGLEIEPNIVDSSLMLLWVSFCASSFFHRRNDSHPFCLTLGGLKMDVALCRNSNRTCTFRLYHFMNHGKCFDADS
ncbi:hypothetical protein CUMW_235440 [Citrus unshiu]|uniref:Uncharacterized protein n=1 Tax=Citrus unshiu TaxID=55188 RepID=A0A2H5QJA1_CITUN|nr:hypothetical protein CUMW_235440 [Citrus unshiu]